MGRPVILMELPDPVRRKAKTFYQKTYYYDRSDADWENTRQEVCWMCGRKKLDIEVEENKEVDVEISSVKSIKGRVYQGSINEGDVTFTFELKGDNHSFWEWFHPESDSLKRETEKIFDTTFQFEYFQRVKRTGVSFVEHHLAYGEEVQDEITISMCNRCHKGYDGSSSRRIYENLRSKPYFESYGDSDES